MTNFKSALSSLLVLLMFLTATHICAQKHDYVWLFGYDSIDNPEDSVFGTSVLDFNEYGSVNFIQFKGESEMDFGATCSSISDAEGNYLFSYNGKYIEDASFQPMQNGLDLSESGDEDGDLFPQQSLILPLPGSKSKYVLFHQTWKYIDPLISIAGFRLYYSIIDMEANNGLGAVTERKILLIQDTADIGKLAATKHANGRDWWVVYPKYNSKEFQRMLLTPSGIEIMPKVKTGMRHREGLGQAHFSPDGSKYAKFSATDYDEGFFLYIYDFDRCNGTLSNPHMHNYSVDFYDIGGIAFSPNSSILYLLATRKIYQFDLASENIIESKNFVDTADSYLDTVPGSNLYIPHSFFCGQLGPDGKIYISSIGSVRVLSTIDRPDIWGKGCHLNQHSIHLPSINFRTISNNPNYRLGPIDGSPCDTLGINNIPLARFRSDQSTEDYLNFEFVDLSDYEPTEWYWEFGDGNTSADINPTHTYASPGIYEVCFTVTNENGSDTHCNTINLATTSTEEQQPHIQVGVFPNPCVSFVNIQLKNYYPRSARIYLYDSQGRFITEKQVFYGMNTLAVQDLIPGMYFYSIIDNGTVLKQGKISKQ